ncbi:MAG: hypothetical protein ACR2K3_07115 [Nocardioides sp.]
MNRRSDRPTLAERIHGTSTGDDDASPVKPCWVTDRHGRLPGLLIEWRRTAAGWQGRVVRPVLERDRWVVVEEWLPAGSWTLANARLAQSSAGQVGVTRPLGVSHFSHSGRRPALKEKRRLDMGRDSVRAYAIGHLGAAHTGVAMFRGAASHLHDSRCGEELSALVSEIEADRESLADVVRDLGGDPDSLAHRTIRVGMEAAGHASRVLHWKEGVSSLSELEKLRSGVAAKTAGWEVLLAASAWDERLSRVSLEQLIERAHDQSNRLRALHLQMAQFLFSKE